MGQMDCVEVRILGVIRVSGHMMGRMIIQDEIVDVKFHDLDVLLFHIVGTWL